MHSIRSRYILFGLLMALSVLGFLHRSKFRFRFSVAKMSVVSTFVANSPSDFDGVLSQAEAANAKHTYILFYAAVDPATGKSWCPDCVRAKPLIDAALAKQTESTVLVVANVERSSYRGNAEYPYRVDPRFELRCVPTLIRWQNGAKVHSLNDLQCQNEDLIEEMFTSY